MQPPSDQQKLDQARAFLQQQQYDQARPLLESMPHNPTAQEWLAFLNQTQQRPSAGQPMYTPPPPPPAPVNLPANLPLAFRSEFRWGVAGLAGLLALIILFIFFFTPLIDGNNFDSYVEDYQDAVRYESRNADYSDDRFDAENTLEDFNEVVQGDINGADVPGLDDIDATAWQVWIGKASSLAINDNDVDYKGNFTLSGSEIEDTYVALAESNDDDEALDILDDFGGFSGVRAIDRLLIIYPIGALLIAVIGVLFAMHRIQARPALITIGVTILVLFVFIFVWQSASTSNWRGSIEKQIDRSTDDMYDWNERALVRAFYGAGLDSGETYVAKAYNTGSLKFFTGLGLLMIAGALAFVYISERQHPQIAAQFRQVQMQRKAQRAYQQPQYMQPPYGAPPPPPQQPITPTPTSQPTPPAGDAAPKDDWTTPQS